MNPRTLLVLFSLLALVRLAQPGDFATAWRQDLLACGLLLALYLALFLVPLARSFGALSVLPALVSATTAWVAAALALLADALPLRSGESALHHALPMDALCLSGSVAFYLFFDSTNRDYRRRDALQAEAEDAEAGPLP